MFVKCMFTIFCHTYYVCKCVQCECSKQNSSKMLRIENYSHNPIQSSAFKRFEFHQLSLNCPKRYPETQITRVPQKVVRSTSRPSTLFKTWARTLSSYKLRFQDFSYLQGVLAFAPFESNLKTMKSASGKRHPGEKHNPEEAFSPLRIRKLNYSDKFHQNNFAI